MFSSAELGRVCPAEEYQKLEPELRMRLFEAQRQCLARRIPVLITVAGVQGAGRGQVVNLLSEWMDAKRVRSHTFWMNTDEEKSRPEAWRFWRCLPAGGETGVFFEGWYARPLRALCCGDMKGADFDSLMRRWARMETSLALSGTVLVKLWLHLGKKEYKARLKTHRRDVRPFTPHDRKIAERYDAYVEAAERALAVTDSAEAPWIIVDAKDARFRNIAVAQALVSALTRAVALHDGSASASPDAGAPKEAEKARSGEAADQTAPASEHVEEVVSVREAGHEASANIPGGITALEAVDLTRKLDHGAYRKRLAALQADVAELTWKAWKKGISSTLVFEGWDAAGKGGSIRRITAAVDARICRVIPVSAPSPEELAHHYLWRFWRHVPRAGMVTIYDRSWYGRVLVERVENLTPPEDWRRAYAEINDFEAQLRERGVLVKCWLHISPEEQLRRFHERENTPWKTYKITQEDWRNREKRPGYLAAAEEMFQRTSTPCAPWHIVPAEDKKFARVEVLRLWRDALKKAL